ncbi:MAG: TIGR02710 family CRISPR-associated CARF protein [Candidatus Aenigmatarchaeota archaeon]|nr:TIGR02710 family CRISPR-associated CARF protein [Methanothermobacter sp.]
MKRTLFMTVGTGVGPSNKKINGLAHGLLTSIEHYNPDMIVFFGSKDSEKTLESLKRQYNEKMGAKLKSYKFIKIENVDDFHECYTKIEKEIKKEEDAEIIIDYTSGTKTMTTSAAICSMLYQKKLSLVTGERGENGIVIPGTEAPREQNLFAAYDKYLFDKVKEAFNHHRFGEAIDYLKRIVMPKEEVDYEKFIQGYDLWDKFDHIKAWELLKNIKKVPPENKEFLGKLTSSMNLDDQKELLKNKGKFLVADLLNNAKRRLKEEKYEDAVARLYRIMELLAQCRLSEFGIYTSNVKIEKIPSHIQDKYNKLRDDEGKVKLGLQKSYELLKDLEDKLGERYVNDKEIKELLKRRNESILAHGLKPITNEDIPEVKKFYEKVEEYAKLIFPEIDDLMEKAKFPKL